MRRRGGRRRRGAGRRRQVVGAGRWAGAAARRGGAGLPFQPSSPAHAAAAFSFLPSFPAPPSSSFTSHAVLFFFFLPSSAGVAGAQAGVQRVGRRPAPAGSSSSSALARAGRPGQHGKAAAAAHERATMTLMKEMATMGMGTAGHGQGKARRGARNGQGANDPEQQHQDDMRRQERTEPSDHQGAGLRVLVTGPTHHYEH